MLQVDGSPPPHRFFRPRIGRGGSQVADESRLEALVPDDFLMEPGEEKLPGTPGVLVDNARQQDDHQDYVTDPAYERKGKQKGMSCDHDGLLTCFLQ